MLYPTRSSRSGDRLFSDLWTCMQHTLKKFNLACFYLFHGRLLFRRQVHLASIHRYFCFCHRPRVDQRLFRSHLFYDYLPNFSPLITIYDIILYINYGSEKELIHVTPFHTIMVTILKLNEVGCPELAGLPIDLNKAKANGWEQPSGSEITKIINDIFIIVDFDIEQKIIDIMGIIGLYDIYTCNCKLISVPPPYTCTNFSQETINQITTEISGPPPPTWLLAVAVGIVVIGGIVYLAKHR